MRVRRADHSATLPPYWRICPFLQGPGTSVIPGYNSSGWSRNGRLWGGSGGECYGNHSGRTIFPIIPCRQHSKQDLQVVTAEFTELTTLWNCASNVLLFSQTGEPFIRAIHYCNGFWLSIKARVPSRFFGIRDYPYLTLGIRVFPYLTLLFGISLIWRLVFAISLTWRSGFGISLIWRSGFGFSLICRLGFGILLIWRLGFGISLIWRSGSGKFLIWCSVSKKWGRDAGLKCALDAGRWKQPSG